MSEENELKQKALKIFTGNKEDMLSKQLERMDGWFDLTGEDIWLNEKIQDLDIGRKYLAFLLANFVLEKIINDNNPLVEHTKANEYFGWEDTARKYASKYSDYLNTERGKAGIKEVRIKDVIDLVEEKIEVNKDE